MGSRADKGFRSGTRDVAERDRAPVDCPQCGFDLPNRCMARCQNCGFYLPCGSEPDEVTAKVARSS